MECPENDLASFANDAINFMRQRRHLMKLLKSNQPVLILNIPTPSVNAEIEIKNDSHRAFLIAACDIQANEEIFCHYGFNYWFYKELSKIGFLQEDEIDKNGFPDRLFDYPSFIAYVKNFYPNYVRHEIIPYKTKL